MKRFLIWMAVIAGILTIFVVVAYLLISSLFDTEPYVTSESYIIIPAGGSLPEYRVPDALREYFGAEGIDLHKIRKIFRMAAADERIEGIILHIGWVRAGYGKLHELHQMIDTYRSSGKKVLAFLEFGLTRDYYLASACDSIYLQPGGNLFLTGMAAEVTFYKEMLAKIGVEADFEHVGKYKNAPDVYTRQSMSKTQREVIDEILDYRYADLIHTISQNRGISAQKIEDFVSNISGFSDREALAENLIDGIRFRPELVDLVSEKEEELIRIPALEYARLNPASLGIGNGPRIAVIYCTGAIMSGEDGTDPLFGETMGAARVVRNIRQAAQNTSIDAIVLRIDSPGGSSLASDKIWFAVQEACKEKPVVASISDLGASGGYMIAIAADTIVAQKSSLIGSIGVYAGKFSIQSLYEKIGFNIETIKRGKNAGMFSLNSKFTASERKILRSMIEDYYHMFVQKVADSRNKIPQEIYPVAQGRVWLGETGKDLDLVDEYGGLDRAVEVAKEMAGIEEAITVRLSYYPSKRSFFSEIVRNISILTTGLRSPLKPVEDYINRHQNKPLALMPFVMELK